MCTITSSPLISLNLVLFDGKYDPALYRDIGRVSFYLMLFLISVLLDLGMFVMWHAPVSESCCFTVVWKYTIM